MPRPLDTPTSARDPFKVKDNRWLASGEDLERIANARLEAGIGKHISPFSVMVAGMGNYWEPGCYEAIMEMCQYTHDQEGHSVAFVEQHDMCYRPYDALGDMRNNIYRSAIIQGFEYLMYVDNDVMPPKDTLLKLMSRLLPIVVPIIEFWDGEDHGLTITQMERNRGTALISGSVISCVLFKTSVFHPWLVHDFWSNSIGSAEGYHWDKLMAVGHVLCADTDVVVKIMKPPHYPLDRKGDIGDDQR